MNKWVLFTCEHQDFKKIVIRGVGVLSDVSEEEEHLLFHHDINSLHHELPSNPYPEGTEDYTHFNELIESIQTDENFKENILTCCEDKNFAAFNHQHCDGYILDMEVIP